MNKNPEVEQTGPQAFTFHKMYHDEIHNWMKSCMMNHTVINCVDVEPHPMGGSFSQGFNGKIRVEINNLEHAVFFKLRWC